MKKNLKETVILPYALFDKSLGVFIPPFFETGAEVQDRIDKNVELTKDAYHKALGRHPEPGQVEAVVAKNWEIKQIVIGETDE